MEETVNRKAEALDLVAKLSMILQPNVDRHKGGVALMTSPPGEAGEKIPFNEILVFKGEAKTPWEAVFDCAGRYYAHVDKQ